MNLLAKEAHNVSNPAKIARLINNRTVLEGPEIRAAAITTLGKFALVKPKLALQIQPILETFKTKNMRLNNFIIELLKILTVKLEQEQCFTSMN